MSNFGEQLSIRIDKLIDNQRKIYRKGMFSGKIIGFYIVNSDGGDPYGLTALEGMTFRMFMNSGLERGFLELDGDSLKWDGEKVDADLDDLIVADGFYYCLRSFWIGGYKCYGEGAFDDWVDGSDNTHGFYFDTNGFLKTPDGQYVSMDDAYDSRYTRLVDRSSYIENSEYYYYTTHDHMIYLEGVAIPMFWTGEWSKVGYWNIRDYDITTDNGDYVKASTWDGEFNLLYNDVPVKVTDEIVIGGRYFIDW